MCDPIETCQYVRRGSHRLDGLCSPKSSLGFLAKQVATWCRGTSKLSIRRLQSFIRRQSLHLLPQTGGIGDQPPRALPTPADGFLTDCRHAQEHQLRASSLPIDPYMGKQIRHTRHTLDMLVGITDCHLLDSLMTPSRTAGVIPLLTQCMGTVLLHFVIELSG